MRIRSTLLIVVAIGSSLSACHKHREQPPAEPAAETPTPAIVQAPAPEPAPEAKPAPAIPAVKAPPKPTADQQILDDADATGMTSHVETHDPEASDAADNSQ